MKRGFCLTCSLVLALIVLTAGSALCATTLVTRVSDELDMKNIEATKVSDQMCLPVRPVAESMGARVTYDKKTRVITVSGASGTAVLRLGDTSATINGARVDFAVAPFVHGNKLFVPVGFYNNYFNMGLIWDPFRQAYRWVWILPPEPYPTPPIIYGPGSGTNNSYAPANGYGAQPPQAYAVPRRHVGEVLRVRPSDSTIVMVSGNTEMTHPVSRTATILRGRVGGRAMEVPLSEIRPGDKVTLTLDDSGTVASIRAQYLEVRGTITSISDGRIALDSGRKLKTTDQTRVVLPGNGRGRIEDLSVGDQLIASVGPISGDTYLISVQQVSTQAEHQSSVYLNTYGPLSTGDVLRVTFMGTAGGKAVMTIPGLLTGAPMAETSPGVYQAEYTVKVGDLLPATPVQVTFTTKDNATYDGISAKPVTIATDSAFLPRIVSPRTGEAIGSPIVISGIAHPNALVSVTVEFSRDIGGILPIEGLSGAQDVRAGADGIWKTDPLPATAPWDDITTELEQDYGVFSPLYRTEQYPTTFVITATEVGSDGTAVSSYTVQPIRGPVAAGL